MKLYIEILKTFLRLGLTSFGGPVAHLGYFREEFVVRKKWLSDSSYADLVALSQFLPGPASSQVGYAIGTYRGGITGGIMAWVGFTLPSALLMVGFAYGVTNLNGDTYGGFLHGLKIAAVAVVAHAVWGMATSLCPDRFRATLAVVTASLLLLWNSVFIQVTIIVAGGLIGYIVYRKEPSINGNTLTDTVPVSKRVGFSSIGLFFLLLAGLPLLSQFTSNHVLDVIDGFYRSGSLVFGGGHVVLPLLQAEVVQSGWITDNMFIAGYGAAQAVPGPLFTFAAYLGTAMTDYPNGLIGGFLCVVSIFAPALLLMTGLLPFWDIIRKKQSAQACLKGTNAVVVGILMAAFYNPVWLKAIYSTNDIVFALLAFAMLQFWRLPSWIVVVVLCIVCGITGQHL